MASITIQLSAPNLELAAVLADVTGGVMHQNGPWLTIEGKRLQITRSEVEQKWGRPLDAVKWRSLTQSRRGHVVEATDQVIVVQDQPAAPKAAASVEGTRTLTLEDAWLWQRLEEEAKRRGVKVNQLAAQAIERFLRSTDTES
jgi:hypothetical protein